MNGLIYFLSSVLLENCFFFYIFENNLRQINSKKHQILTKQGSDIFAHADFANWSQADFQNR